MKILSKIKTFHFLKNSFLYSIIKKILLTIADYLMAFTYLAIINKNLILIKIKNFFTYFGFFIVLIIYLYLFSLFAFPYALLEIDFIILKSFLHELSYTIPEFFKEHFKFIIHSTWRFLFTTLVLTIYYTVETIGVPSVIMYILVIAPIDFVLDIVLHIFDDLEYYEYCFIDSFFFIILIYKNIYKFFTIVFQIFSYTFLLENIITSFCFLPFFIIIFIIFAIITIYNFYFILPAFIIWYLTTFNYLFFRHQAYKRMRRVYYFLHPITKEVLNVFYYEIGPLLQLTYGNIFLVIFGFIFLFISIFFETFLVFFNLWNRILDISIREHDYDNLDNFSDRFILDVKEECYYRIPSENDTFYLNDVIHEFMLFVHNKIIMDTYQHHFFERYLYYGLNGMDYHLEFIRIFSIIIYGYYFLIFFVLAPLTFYFFCFYICICFSYIIALPCEYLKSFVMSKRYYSSDKWNFQDPRTYAELIYPHVKQFILSLCNDYSSLKNFNFNFIKYYLIHLKKSNLLLKKVIISKDIVNIFKIIIYFFSELPVNYLKDDLHQYYIFSYNIFKKYYDDALAFEQSVKNENRPYLTCFENLYYYGCLFAWWTCVVIGPTLIFYVFYFLNILTTYKSLIFCSIFQIPCFIVLVYLMPFYNLKKDINTIKMYFNTSYNTLGWLINYFILNFNYNLIINDFMQFLDKKTKHLQYFHEVQNLHSLNTIFDILFLYPLLYFSGWIRAKCLTTPELTNIEMPFTMRFYKGYFSYIFQYYAWDSFDQLSEVYLQFTLNYRFWILDKYLQLEKENYKLILNGFTIHRHPLLNLLSWWIIFLKDFRLKSTRHREMLQKVNRDIVESTSLKFKKEYSKFFNFKSFILYKQTKRLTVDATPYKGAFLIPYLHSRFLQILELAQIYYLEILKNRILVPTNELLYFDTQKKLKDEKKKELKKQIEINKTQNVELDIYDTLDLITKYSEFWKTYSISELLLASSEQQAYLFPEYIKKSFFDRIEERLIKVPLFKYVNNVGNLYLNADPNYKYSYHVKKRAVRFSYYEKDIINILKFKWYNFKISCRPITHFKIPLHYYDYKMIYEFLNRMNLISIYYINVKKNNIDVDIDIKLNSKFLLEINLYYFITEDFKN